MRNMRATDEMFIVNKKKYLFILKTQKEADAFKKGIDLNIEKMHHIKKKADAWVREKKYSTLA